jgi:signal transduction histidine kinase
MSDRAPSLLQTLVDEAIHGILGFDESGASVYMNRLAREILEIEADTLTVAEICPEPSNAKSYARSLTIEMIATDGFFPDVMMRKRNGLFILARLRVKKVINERGETQSFLMFQDITIQKKLERDLEAKQEEIKKTLTELLEQNRQLKELDQAKDRFIALTTHELRTPLAAIVATAEVLDLKLYESEEQKEGFIKTIHEQGLHIMALVNDILDFAKIRAGKMEFFVEQIDLVPVVSKLAANFRNFATQGLITLDIQKNVPSLMCYADTLRLKEVINNVVNNAIKYNRAQGRVEIKFEAHGSFARVIVSDTGLGIPGDKLHHVFNEFETVEGVARHHKGTGLGMPISKRLMLAMGGELTLESREGIGTSFYIDLPVDKVLAEEMYRSRLDSWGDQAA